MLSSLSLMMNDIYVKQNTALRCWLHSSGLLTGLGACRVETKQWTCHPPSLPGSRDDGDITLLTYHITSDSVTLQILFDINSACLPRNEAKVWCFSLDMITSKFCIPYNGHKIYSLKPATYVNKLCNLFFSHAIFKQRRQPQFKKIF